MIAPGIAVTNAPGLGPEIYLGSYNGSFYAINGFDRVGRRKLYYGGKVDALILRKSL